MWIDVIYTHDMGQPYVDHELLHQWHWKMLHQHFDPTEPEAGTIVAASDKREGFDTPEELVAYLTKEYPDNPILGLGELSTLVEEHNGKLEIPEWL